MNNILSFCLNNFEPIKNINLSCILKILIYLQCSSALTIQIIPAGVCFSLLHKFIILNYTSAVLLLVYQKNLFSFPSLVYFFLFVTNNTNRSVCRVWRDANNGSSSSGNSSSGNSSSNSATRNNRKIMQKEYNMARVIMTTDKEIKQKQQQQKRFLRHYCYYYNNYTR